MLTGRVLRTTAVVTALLVATGSTALADGGDPAGDAAAARSAAPVFGAPGAGDDYHPFQGNGGYQVDHYDIAVDYNPKSHQLRGVATISATTTQALKGFDLDLLGYRVDSVKVDGKKAAHRRAGEHELVVRPKQVLKKGKKFTVVVAYHGVPDENSNWYYSPSGGAFAVGQPEAASSWFPVNETTRDKATFTLRATVPTGWSVVSNGVRGTTTSAKGKKTFTWIEKTPITGYLTTIAIDRFSFLTQKRTNGMELLSAFAPGMEANKAVEKRLPEILDFEESIFGKYPIGTGGGIYEKGPFSAGLETQGRSTYMVAEGSTATATVENVVHENAHQWWGDSVSVRKWAGICLNECVSAYAEDLWNEAKTGLDIDQKYRDTVTANLKNPDFWSAKLRKGGVDSEMFNAVYYRGPLFMHALRTQVGDKGFFSALKSFPALHRNKTATLQQFLDLVSARSGKNIKAFAHAWLDGTKIPAAKYLWPGDLKPAR